jgi:hypothetical protein
MKRDEKTKPCGIGRCGATRRVLRLLASFFAGFLFVRRGVVGGPYSRGSQGGQGSGAGQRSE